MGEMKQLISICVRPAVAFESIFTDTNIRSVAQ